MKSLAVARNVVGHLKRTKASPIAVQLMEKLLPLFAAVRLMGEPKPRGQALVGDSYLQGCRSYSASLYQGFSELRELSISLFRDLMKTVVRKNERQMKTKVEMGLLPLIFHTSDQIHSVAKVQIPKLSSDVGMKT